MVEVGKQRKVILLRKRGGLSLTNKKIILRLNGNRVELNLANRLIIDRFEKKVDKDNGVFFL